MSKNLTAPRVGRVPLAEAVRVVAAELAKAKTETGTFDANDWSAHRKRHQAARISWRKASPPLSAPG